ncbi:glycosyltransferase [Candidatus Parcubacteria bacterium]|nr:MAG: glycosyltransferase [Candidatus Parcubacteria bacterium]
MDFSTNQSRLVRKMKVAFFKKHHHKNQTGLKLPPLNILFIIYDLERGGPEMRLLNFAKYFPPQIKMHICVTSENLSLLEEFNHLNIPIKVIPVGRPYVELDKVKNIIHYCKAKEISIINTFDLKGAIIASFIKLFGKTRVQHVYHNVNSLINYSTLQRIVLRFFLKYSNFVLCNSFFSEKEFLTHFPTSKTKVIYNGVDTSRFQDAFIKKNDIRLQYGLDTTDIVLGIIANFRKQKNYPFLLEAFAKLSKEYPDLKLVCVGGGPLLQSVKILTRKLNMSDKIIFSGYTSHIVSLLKSFDILVLTSIWEGMPNVIIEAMCMGVPVVSSNVGGCPEIIDHNIDGLLFKPNDVEDFVLSVKKLLAETHLGARLGEQARDKIKRKFSVEIMIENYVNFFEEIHQASHQN